MTETVVCYAAGATPLDHWCFDGSGQVVGRIEVADGILAERRVVRPDGSTEAVLRCAPGVGADVAAVEVWADASTVLGRLIRHRLHYRLEIDGKIVAKVSRQDGMSSHLNGFEVTIDGSLCASFRMRTATEELLCSPAMTSQCTVTADPAFLVSIRGMSSLLPIMVELFESSGRWTGAEPSTLRSRSADWFEDPWGPSRLRWFDGRWWTDQVSAAGLPSIDARIGARSAASGGGSVLSEPVTVWDDASALVTDGAGRLVGFAQNHPAATDEPSVRPPFLAWGEPLQERHISTATGVKEGTLRFDEAGHGNHVDRVDLVVDDHVIGSYGCNWDGRGMVGLPSPPSWFRISVEIEENGRLVGRVGDMSPSPPTRSTVEIGGRPVASIGATQDAPESLRRPLQVSTSALRLNPWAIEIDPTLPLDLRRLVAALPGVVNLVRARHIERSGSYMDNGVYYS